MSLKEMFWNKDKLSSRNRIIVYLIIGFLVVGFFKFEGLLRVNEELIELEGGNCYLENMDEDGNGFFFPTEYCPQLKIQCSSDIHKIPCEWIEIEEENLSVCRCDMYVIDILSEK